MGNTRNLGDLLNADSTIATADVADGGITTAKLADDAVTTAKVANDVAISTSGAITTTGAFTSKGIDDNADANVVTITSAEAVGIGKSLTPNNYSGYQVVTIGGSDATTGSVLDFEDSNGNIEAEISGTAGRLYLDADPTSATASGFIHLGVDGNQVLKLDDSKNVTIADGNLVIGTAGHGIDFSAETGDGPSVTSELLDSYEEGHIGTITMNSSGSNTIDSAYSSKYYIKVGRVVHCYFHIVLNGTLSAGSHALVGLPFTSSNSNPAHRGAGVANAQDASSSYGQDGNYVSITTSENVTSATLYNPVQYVANDRLNVYFSYVTAS